MAGLGDYAAALKFRDVMETLVKATVERNRPQYQYATVVAFNRSTRKCTVQFPGEATSVIVSMGAIQPAAVGQVVRVDGLVGDRFVSDVMGQPYNATEVWTAATRPTSPTVGQMIFESDTGKTRIWTGTAWKSLTPDVLTAAATGSATMTGGTLTAQDVPGASLTFTTVTANAVCEVFGVFDFSFNTAGFNVATGHLVVDGATQTAQALMHENAARGTHGQTWKVTLAAAGSHTLKLQGNRSVAAGSVSALNPHTTITATVWD